MDIIVSHDYLLKLANNNLKDEEILKGYFKYYFCQNRNLNDLNFDYIKAKVPIMNKMSDYLLFESLNTDDINKAIEKLENVLNEFLKTHFDLKIKNTLTKC